MKGKVFRAQLVSCVNSRSPEVNILEDFVGKGDFIVDKRRGKEALEIYLLIKEEKIFFKMNLLVIFFIDFLDSTLRNSFEDMIPF